MSTELLRLAQSVAVPDASNKTSMSAVRFGIDIDRLLKTAGKGSEEYNKIQELVRVSNDYLATHPNDFSTAYSQFKNDLIKYIEYKKASTEPVGRVPRPGGLRKKTHRRKRGRARKSRKTHHSRV